MSSAQVSRPLLQTAGDMEPVKDKRLELGNKVFKVPTQSKRKSSRIQRPEVSNDGLEKKPTEIFHNLLLAPTLKRQMKKKLARERRANRRRRKYFKSKPKIKISDVFTKRNQRSRSVKRPQSAKKTVTIILDDSKVYAVRNETILPNDLVRIRHLARCGGTQSVSGLEVFDEIEWHYSDDSEVPPPFEAKDDDPYITPQPGQLISYVWYTRPSPVDGRKEIYRTGILCATDGTTRFFDNEDECLEDRSLDRKYFEGKFYLNKNAFTMGNFRVRTDLVVGAICYERERKFPCKILKIDEECGAVLVEKLKSEGSADDVIWISPDDLVGNYTPINKNVKKTQSTMGQISPACVSVQETIDLTEDDEEESDPGLVTPDTISARYRSLDSLSRVLHPESTYVPQTQSETLSDDERAIAKIVADACKSLQPPSTIISAHSRGRDVRIQDAYENKIANALNDESYLPEQSQSYLLRYTNEDPRTIGFGIMGSSSNLSSYGSMVMKSEYVLLKQHRMALEILMSANDFVTIQATLQHIKNFQQRGVPMGPNTADLVSNKERTSRALMDDAFLRHMTTPIWSGGKGYNASHTRIILSRLAPIFASGLGRLDSPMINSVVLLNLGLDGVEASDVIPYLQALEEDILMKTLKIKRQLSAVL